MMTTLAWRKSTFSGGNGACVEIAWRKSSSSAGSGNCVEIAPTPTAVLVRDSKTPSTPYLTVPTPHFHRFLNTVTR